MLHVCTLVFYISFDILRLYTLWRTIKKKYFIKKTSFLFSLLVDIKSSNFEKCVQSNTPQYTQKSFEWLTWQRERERERQSWHETHRSMMLKIIGACKTIINWRAGSLFKRGQQLHKTNDGHSNLCSCYLGLPTYLRLAQKRVDNMN